MYIYIPTGWSKIIYVAAALLKITDYCRHNYIPLRQPSRNGLPRHAEGRRGRRSPSAAKRRESKKPPRCRTRTVVSHAQQTRSQTALSPAPPTRRGLVCAPACPRAPAPLSGTGTYCWTYFYTGKQTFDSEFLNWFYLWKRNFEINHYVRQLDSW